MDRILYKEANGDITCRSRDFDKVFPTLYAYEETGLTPEQIVAMKGLHTARQDLQNELEKVSAERDFLLKKLRDSEECEACIHEKKMADDEPCKFCISSYRGKEDKWEWKGME